MRNEYSNVPTSVIPFQETEHGRLRRQQRGIDKKDLQRALKHGKQRPCYWGRHRSNTESQYVYNNIVYTVKNKSKKEVTAWAEPVKLDLVPISRELEEHHDAAMRRLQSSLDDWTSNTVLVVDTSGSMKASDMWGTRNRLDAVWLSLALDFVAQRIEGGGATSHDVVSVITFGDETTCIIKEWPCTWVLYNEIVKIYNRSKIPPKGHGPFLPGLLLADELLARNSNASCAVGLTFLSDGAPSDPTLGTSLDEIVVAVEHLAKRFGRRFTFMAIGIGDAEEFQMLQRMVDAALDYGAIASLRLPSMTSTSLGITFSSVATSITNTQVEMTDLETKSQRKVRPALRESRKKASETITVVSEEDFVIYSKDRVTRRVYKEVFVGREKKKTFEEVPLQNPEAQYVAMSKGPFGEGAERFVFRFFELASDRKTILGKALVAKESRLILDEGLEDEKMRRQFVLTFCSTQQLAKRLADEFNEKLQKTRRADPDTPRIKLLDCSIYKLNDSKLGSLSVLVEEKLDHNRWFKWNANNGFVEGMNEAPKFSEHALRSAMVDMKTTLDLGLIEEGSEEDSDDDESYDDPNARSFQTVLFSPSQVAQAFSHFSYMVSGRKRLVCDLQGVYNNNERVLYLSDPVIHYYNHRREERTNVHGRTDKGRKGMAMFFETHHEHCEHLCKLMNRGFVRRKQNQ